MANISSSNTSTDPNKDECIATINEKTFDLWCLAPALVIILILSCLKRRSNFKLDYCNGHPGLLIPINFFGSFKNRFTIAATFGATASTFFTNAKSGLFTIPGPAWVTIFDALIAVLVYGILFYPFFACLTTEYKLVGSLLGFLYVSMRFSLELVIDFQCKSSYEKHEKTYQYIEMLGGLPTYFCLLFIAMRFGVLLFLEVRHKWLKCTSERRYQAVGVVACLIEKQGIVHVRQLLNPGITSDMADEKWYTRLIYRIYKPRADFKFSAQLISTLVVAVIILFQFLIKIVIILEKHKRDLESNSSANDSYDALVRLVFGSLQGGYIVAAFFAILILLHFMKCHRDHVFQLYRGKMAFCQDVFVSPAQLVGRSLRFSGYQIAYVFTGNVIMGLFMAIIAVILGFIFKYAKDIFNAEALNGLKEIALTMVLPTVSMAIFLWGFQVFLELFVFRDRDFPNNITITVDNKRLFSIMSYLFFFYNILLGVFSCLVRILKGMFLGVVFLSRIDRTSMMQGFQTWDKAFVAYLGFIHVLVAHSHPVMLMFCQLLINRNKDENLQESPEQAHPRELHFPRMSHQAINRWFLAVTLLRNPSLIKYRRQGGVRPIVTIYGITNHNYDSNALL